MMKKYIVLIALIGVLQTLSQAQQESHFTQFMHNQLTINPAYAGVRGVGSFTALYRKQWIGFAGAPETALLSFNSPFISRKVGIGITLANQKIGVFDNWNGALAYSYNIKISRNAGLRIGVQGSVRRYAFDLSDPSVIIRNPNDPNLALGNEKTKIVGNFGAGFFLTVKDFYVGASVPYFYKNPLSLNGTTSNAVEQPHIYGMAGTVITVSESLDVRPSILAKFTQNAPFDLDANLSLMFSKKFLIGGSYRLGGDGSGESASAVALWQINQRLALGVGYDFTLTQIRKDTDGSFEVLVRYELKRQSSDMANPRFFF